MRVIGGRFRSRKLKTVPGLTVRPTPDRLREALFNVLTGKIEGSTFLDAYAGSGAVAIEALSRGAGHAILFEQNPRALAIIRENVEALQLSSEVTLVRGSAAKLLASYKAEVVFIDPPYEQVKEYDASLLALSETNSRLVIAQHPSRLGLEERYGRLQRFRVLRQGDNSLSFFESVSAGE